MEFDIIPTSIPAPYRVLRLQVDVQNGVVRVGRYLLEDDSTELYSLRRLISAAKGGPTMSAGEVVEGAMQIPEIRDWQKARPCRHLRLEMDQEGATYYSVDLYEQCSDEKNGRSVAWLRVDKSTAGVVASGGIALTTKVLPDAQAILERKRAALNVLSESVKSACRQR